MSHKNEKIFSRSKIQEAIDNSLTMGAAAQYLKVDWRTFRKEAEKYGLYKIVKRSTKKFELQDILNGKHPQYPTSKLLPRLIDAGLKTYNCESCGISDYNGKKIGLEVNHIDGFNGNHILDNLQILCPNCHSQTSNYRSKKLKMEDTVKVAKRI